MNLNIGQLTNNSNIYFIVPDCRSVYALIPTNSITGDLYTNVR